MDRYSDRRKTREFLFFQQSEQNAPEKTPTVFLLIYFRNPLRRSYLILRIICSTKGIHLACVIIEIVKKYKKKTRFSEKRVCTL